MTHHHHPLAALYLALSMALLPASSLAAGKDDHKDHQKEEQHEEKHDDHASHKSELKGVTALHAWTRAAHKGENSLVFVELENTSKQPVKFLGGKSKHSKSVQLVGFQLKDGEPTYVPLEHLPIKAGGHLDLAPKAIALRLNDLTEDLEKGHVFKMGLNFDIGHMHVNVEIGSEDAKQHSHAGHNHN